MDFLYQLTRKILLASGTEQEKFKSKKENDIKSFNT